MENPGVSRRSTREVRFSGPAFRIVVASLGLEFDCGADQSLLAAMIASGKRALDVGCRSGGCGVCRVHVTRGRYRTGFMNRSIITQADEASGLLLACRTFPASDMAIEPRQIGRQAPSYDESLAA